MLTPWLLFAVIWQRLAMVFTTVCITGSRLVYYNDINQTSYIHPPSDCVEIGHLLGRAL